MYRKRVRFCETVLGQTGEFNRHRFYPYLTVEDTSTREIHSRRRRRSAPGGASLFPFSGRKLLPQVQASTLQGALKNMAGKSRHLIGAVSRGRLFRDGDTCPPPPPPARNSRRAVAGREVRATRRRRPGGVRCVPSVISRLRRRECVARCLASVVSRTAGPPFAGTVNANYWHITGARDGRLAGRADDRPDSLARAERSSDACEGRGTCQRTPHFAPLRLPRVVRVPLPRFALLGLPPRSSAANPAANNPLPGSTSPGGARSAASDWSADGEFSGSLETFVGEIRGILGRATNLRDSVCDRLNDLISNLVESKVQID